MWSVVITVFGDAIEPRGGVVGLGSLMPVMNRLGIEANAVRTAMSRLARDGWVERKRLGRQSFYALVEDGREPFESAARRIYATSPADWSGVFEAVILKDQDHKSRSLAQKTMRQLGFGSPLPDLYVRPKHDLTRPGPAGFSAVEFEAAGFGGNSLADLVKLSWPVGELSGHYRALHTMFQPVAANLEASSQLPILESLCLRILLIHEWRKLILRDVELPMDCKPGGEAEADARELVSKLYRELLEPSETFLDECYCGLETRLPRPKASFASRFKRQP